MWIVTELNGSVHVYPNNDLILHEESHDCVCGPRITPVIKHNGKVGYYMVHHSLDGREAKE